MEKSAFINVRVDATVKKEVESILEFLGLNISTAINMYFMQILMHQSIPFEIGLKRPNKELLAAIKEGEEMEKNGYKDVKLYSQEEFEKLLFEDD